MQTESDSDTPPSAYLTLPDGSTFVPIGMNLSFPRFATTGAEGLAFYEDWIRNLASSGANFIRLWLGHWFFDPEGERCVDFRKEKMANLRSVLDMAETGGLKVKLTLDHFRFIQTEPVAEMFPNAVSFERGEYHVSVPGGIVENIGDYFASEAGRRHFLKKLDFFAEHIGDHTAIVAWELWNEISTVRADTWMEWTEFMLPELRKRFPGTFCLQSCGSGSHAGSKSYAWLANLEETDIAQVHRYLDCNPDNPPVCHGPMDENAADAVRFMRSIAPKGRPVLLAESGAVQPRHAGPFQYYPEDTNGAILHDVLYAGCFAGGCGSGQSWHWDQYVGPNRLWWHFRPFAAILVAGGMRGRGFLGDAGSLVGRRGMEECRYVRRDGSDAGLEAIDPRPLARVSPARPGLRNVWPSAFHFALRPTRDTVQGGCTGAPGMAAMRASGPTNSGPALGDHEFEGEGRLFDREHDAPVEAGGLVGAHDDFELREGVPDAEGVGGAAF